MSGALSRRTTVAAALAAGGLSLLFAAPGQGNGAVECAYVEAGPPGPPGNVLRIDDDSDTVVHIYRRGEEIRIFDNAAIDQPICTGGTPTVFNVDRIEYSTSSSTPFIAYSGTEALAPGATPEGSGPEIEIIVRETYRPAVLNLGGTAGADTIVAGRLGRQRIGINLNSQADGAAQDADVLLEADPRRAVVRVVGKDGADTLSALGKPGFAGPLDTERLLLAGGPDDDVMIGGPGVDRLSGGTGDDVMRGGRGRDRVTIGPGRDLAKTGKGADRVENRSDVGGIPPDEGPDRVFTGPGNDWIELERSPRGNLIHCGTGSRDSAIVNVGDRATACERVETTPR
jgi:Ca2+-binding RTX toxin-like protein